MRRFVPIVLAALAVAPAASAHPLGNFTINHFSRVEVAGHRIYVRYVVDMAEIPTLQRVPLTTTGLVLRVDGREAHLRVLRTALAHPRGAAGLHTTRFQAILAGPRVAGNVRIDYRDESIADLKKRDLGPKPLAEVVALFAAEVSEKRLRMGG